MHLRNVADCVLYIDNGDGGIPVNPGEKMDVDGRKSWDEHPFVKEGWLEVVDEKPQKSQPEKQAKK